MKPLHAFVLGFVTCLATIAAVGLLARAKAQTWLTAPLASLHMPRSGYNQVNLGIGLEHHVAERWRLVIGTYRNSNREDSVYVGAIYTRWRLGDCRLGTSIGLVSGYGRDILPMVAPAIAYERKGWGLNLILIPPVGKAPAVIGLQAKVEVR